MFNHHYEMIVTQKQNEVEQYAKEAWKFDGLKNKGTYQRILLLIKAFYAPTKSVNNKRTCEVC